MLKLSTSHVSGILALITAAFVMNGVACSSSKPAKKSAAGAGEEDDCETSTSTKKSTSKLTDEFELTQTGTGSNSSTGSSTATKTGSGTSTATGTEEGPTYNGEVKTLIDKKCANSGCHAKGGQEPDLSTLANIKKEKEDFFKTLDPEDDKAMPPGGESKALKADELKLLEDWKENDFAEGEADDTGSDTGSATSTKSSTSTSKSTSTCGSTSKKTEEEEEEEEE